MEVPLQVMLALAVEISQLRVRRGKNALGNRCALDARAERIFAFTLDKTKNVPPDRLAIAITHQSGIDSLGESVRDKGR